MFSKSKKPSPPCGGCCTKLIDFGVTIGETMILQNINLHVHCGELTSIIGPNGAGKTTLLRAMLGEIPHSGEIHFVNSNGSSFGKPRIGYVPQRIDIDRTAPISVLDLFASANTRYPVWLGYGKNLRENSVKMLSLVEAEHVVDMKLAHLSGGQFQRVILALSLNPLPDLLLLDEPISGVDKSGTDMFYKVVSRLRREFDLSIILISHDLTEAAKFSDRMILLNKVILKDGEPLDMLGSNEIKQVFGADYSAVKIEPEKKERAKVERNKCPPE